MKKVFSILAVLLLAFALVGCNKPENGDGNGNGNGNGGDTPAELVITLVVLTLQKLQLETNLTF